MADLVQNERAAGERERDVGVEHSDAAAQVLQSPEPVRTAPHSFPFRYRPHSTTTTFPRF